MWTENFQTFKLDLEKAEEPEITLPTSIESLKKQRDTEKTSTSALLTMPKFFTVCITANCKIHQEMEYQTTWPASWEIYMQIKKQQLKPDMEQPTGSKLGKEYVNAVYCHPAYWTYMQNIAWEMPGWMKRKLESRLLGDDAGRDWGQEEKGMTEDEMAGWHHWLDGHEFEEVPGIGDGQGGLAYCNSWGCRVGHDWATEMNWYHFIFQPAVYKEFDTSHPY